MNQISVMTLPYVKVGDYYYPNFAVPPPVGDIGYYGRLRRKCLIEHHPVLLNQLVLSGKLFEHLADINRQATERRDVLMQQMKEKWGVTEELKARDQMAWVQQMKEKWGVTEELKARDQMAWVQQMNNIRACVDEIIFKEIVFA